MQIPRSVKICILLCLYCQTDCGGSSIEEDLSQEESEETETGTDNVPDDEAEAINTDKLSGTPFVGLITGDGFELYDFTDGRFYSDSIESFPIPIFTAFFTGAEEAQIEAGIVIANEAIGFEAYRTVTIWSDEVRVIYKVSSMDSSGNAVGRTVCVEENFDGKIYAARECVDWSIEILDGHANEFVIAHELGHATGISAHALIDYDNDALKDLESDSVMGPYGGTSLNDYAEMMWMQGIIMSWHLGEQSRFRTIKLISHIDL